MVTANLLKAQLNYFNLYCLHLNIYGIILVIDVVYWLLKSVYTMSIYIDIDR